MPLKKLSYGLQQGKTEVTTTKIIQRREALKEIINNFFSILAKKI